MKTNTLLKTFYYGVATLLIFSSSVCFGAVHDGSLYLATQADVDAASGISEVTGDITIATEFWTNDPIVNLNGLSGLQSVGGSLSLSSNPELTDTLGLLSLTDVGSLVISFNDTLDNLDGLSNLVVADYLLIVGNAALQRYCGLYMLFLSQGVDWNYYIVDGWQVYASGSQGVLQLIGDPCPLPPAEEAPVEPEPEPAVEPEQYVEQLLTEGVLNQGEAKSMINQLRQKKPGSLLNHINALVKSGRLTEAEAQPLIEAAVVSG